MKEKRKFSRAVFDGRARLLHQGVDAPVTLVDLSMKGALLSLPKGMAPTTEDPAKLTLLLDDSDVIIPLEVVTRRTSEDQAGVEFKRLSLEAMQHLRRLVELNLGEDQNLDSFWLE